MFLISEKINQNYKFINVLNYESDINLSVAYNYEDEEDVDVYSFSFEIKINLNTRELVEKFLNNYYLINLLKIPNEKGKNKIEQGVFIRIVDNYNFCIKNKDSYGYIVFWKRFENFLINKDFNKLLNNFKKDFFIFKKMLLNNKVSNNLFY